MRNRATAIRVVLIVWIIAAVGGDVGWRSAPSLQGKPPTSHRAKAW